MIGHFAWKVKDAFYYFRFEIVVQVFRQDEPAIAFGRHEFFIDGSEMLAKCIVSECQVEFG